MIIREAPIDNAWYRAAGVWFIAFLGANCLAWPLLDYYHYDLDRFRWLAISMPLGSFTFWVVGKFLHNPKRVSEFVMVLGLFGILPLLIAISLPVLAFVFFTLDRSKELLIFGVTVLAISACWINSEIAALKLRISDRKFIEREFEIAENFIYLNRSPKTSLEPQPAEHGSWQNSVGRWLALKLVFLVPLAYPLQRLVSDKRGMPAILLLLSILSLPLAIHILGRMSCGYYLWIRTIRKLEHQHGKPVVFERS